MAAAASSNPTMVPGDYFNFGSGSGTIQNLDGKPMELIQAASTPDGSVAGTMYTGDEPIPYAASAGFNIYGRVLGPNQTVSWVQAS